MSTSFNELNPLLSPDGRWLAYQSDESGRDEVYVRPFPNVDGGRWQISASGGTRPVWSRNGAELFFVDASFAMMAASVGVTPTFHASSPLKLFDASVYWPGIQTGRAFDVAPDGRFIFIKEVNDPWRKPPVVAVLNWVDDLKSKSRR